MKSIVPALLTGSLVITLISGCSKSNDTADSTPATPEPPAAPAAPAAPAPTTPPAATKAPTAPAPPRTAANLPKLPTVPPVPTAITPPGINTMLQSLTVQLASSGSVQGDPVLKDITREIGTRAKALGDTVGKVPAAQDVLKGTLSALSNGKDQEALAAYEKIVAAKLTPQQTALANELKNTVSAFVVQRNFSSLAGAEGQVGQLVTAFRKGDTATAITALKQVGANAQLTANQKGILSSIANQAGPALNQATEALKTKLPGFN